MSVYHNNTVSSLSILERYPNDLSASLSSAQIQLDAAISGFADQASDISSLASMMAGSLAYGFTRVGILASPLQKFTNVVSPFAAVAGLGVEVLTYRTAHQGLQRLTSGSVIEESILDSKCLLRDFVQFGTLKTFAPLIAGQNPILAHVIQSSSLVAANNLTSSLGLTPQTDGSIFEQFAHAEITNLQMQTGMSLFSAFTGHRFARVEKCIGDARTLHQTKNFPFSISSQGLDIFYSGSEFKADVQSRGIRYQASFPAGYFFDGKKFAEAPAKTDVAYHYYELMQRVGNRAELRRYIEENLDPESRVLSQLTSNAKPMPVLHEVQAVIGMLRFLPLREEAGQTLRTDFFDVIAAEENPQVLARHERWKAENPVMPEMVSWLLGEGMTHADPWTRHYSIRLIDEWVRVHPEISQPEHAALKEKMIGLAHVALSDVAWTNMMLGWHLLHRLTPEEALNDRYLAGVPLAHVMPPQNLEFGLRRYVDATRAEGAFLKYQRSLSGIPVVIGNEAVMGSFSLNDIHPSHSLADFNPNSFRRFGALRSKYKILEQMESEGRLTRENVLKDFLMHEDPVEGPVIFHWQGRNPWLKGGHHRMTALYLAAENRLIPREGLREMPLQTFDWSKYLPERIYRQFFSRGAEPLEWTDLFPPHYAIEKVD